MNIYVFYIILIICPFLYSQNTVLKVDPQKQTLPPDSSINISIVIENVSNLHAYTLKLNYDSSILSFRELKKLDFLSLQQSFFSYQVDSTNGYIKLDEAILGSETVSGTGGLINLRFSSKSPGVSALYFSDYSLRDENNGVIPVDTVSGIVEIGIINSSTKKVLQTEANHSVSVYPNPFNNSALLNYNINFGTFVTIKLFNLLGEEIYTLVNDYQSPGKHVIRIDGTDLSSGIYFCLFQTANYMVSKKLILLK